MPQVAIIGRHIWHTEFGIQHSTLAAVQRFVMERDSNTYTNTEGDRGSESESERNARGKDINFSIAIVVIKRLIT